MIDAPHEGQSPLLRGWSGHVPPKVVAHRLDEFEVRVEQRTLRPGAIGPSELDVVPVVHGLLLEVDREQLLLEVRRCLPGLVRRGSPVHHCVPIVQVRMLMRTGLQVRQPAIEGLSVEPGFSGYLLGVSPSIGHPVTGDEEVGRALHQDIDQLVSFLLQEQVDGELLFLDSLVRGIVGFHLFRWRQGVAMILCAAEHALHRVEIGLGDRIELVIVALRTGDREAQKRPSRHIDAVVVAVPQGMESQCREILAPFGLRQKVGRELQHDEPVVRKTTVECVDHPVTVSPGVRQRRIRVSSRLPVCIAGQIEPVPR